MAFLGDISGMVSNAITPQIAGTATNPSNVSNGLTFSAGTTPLNANFGSPELTNQQVTDALYKQQTQFLDPQFQRSQAALENQLANQGITRGSEAWRNSMDIANAQKQQAYESARNSAINQGVNAGSTMFQNQLAGLQAGNTAQNQSFAQQLANAQLGNQAYLGQTQLDVAKENAAKMADAMKTGGLYSLGGSLLGSPTGSAALGNILSGAGTGVGGLLTGLGGLFGSGSANAALPDWAVGITDPETLAALGLASKAPGLLGGLTSSVGGAISSIGDALGF